MNDILINACVGHVSELLFNKGVFSNNLLKDVMEFTAFGVIVDQDGKVSSALTEDEFFDSLQKLGKTVSQCALCSPGYLKDMQGVKGIKLMFDKITEQLWIEIPVKLTKRKIGLFSTKTEITNVSIDESDIISRKGDFTLINSTQDTRSTFDKKIAEAEDGNAESQNYVGSSYITGKNNITKDIKKGIFWLQQSVDQSNAKGQHLLGTIYCATEFGLQDVDNGLRLLKDSAKQGYPDAMVSLGKLYCTGGLIPIDYGKAIYMFSQASERGSSLASALLGNMYHQGNGVSIDFENSLMYFKLAAKKGLAQAQFSISMMYIKGEGTDINYTSAEEWLLKAAAQGLAEAEYSLFLLYYKGHTGVPKDHDQAIIYLKKASKNGHSKANENLQSYNISKLIHC